MAFEHMRAFFQRYVPMVNTEIEWFFEAKKRELEKEDERIRSVALEHNLQFIQGGGKRLRPMLVILGALGAGKDVDETILRTAAAYEMLHAFLLIHDDICDRDKFRRGKPTVWWAIEQELLEQGLPEPHHNGTSLAMLAGDILYTYVYRVLLELDLEPAKKTLITNHIARIVEYTGYGQIMDMYIAASPLSKIKEDQVMYVYRLKTGVYTMEGPLHTGALLADAQKELLSAYSEYGINTGIAFQIHDDIIGAFGDPKKTGKPVGSDIREHKKTILLLFAYQMGDEKQRNLLEQAMSKELSEEEVLEILDVIRDTGALEKAQKLEREYVERGKRALDKVELPDEVKNILLELADFVVSRDH